MNHASIGSPFATTGTTVGPANLQPGLIQVLFAGSGSINPDANANGLADEWEQQYFPGQSVDPLADSDGDGTSNLMEYLAGTSPMDPGSRFQPSGDLSGTTYTMPLLTTTGRTYKVWVTRDLQTWELQQTYAGDGSLKVFTFDESSLESGPLHSTTHPASYFFRVEITQP